MSYQALYRAWRPETFSEIVDQDAAVRTLRRQVATDHIAHAYLFCGTRGTGKTTAAKVLSRAVNCLNPKDGDPCGECAVCRAILDETCMDVLEIDAASNNSVDEIRDLRDKIKYPPVMTRYKVYIIDEVHMLSTGAFNALLKTLEEPPKHAVFILATTEPQKLPATIHSRCQRFDFHRISVQAIIGRLQTVLRGIGREAEPDALREIARAAEGALRDALSLLDVCLSFTEGVVTAELARDVLGTTGRDFMFEFADRLIEFDAASVLRMIDEAMRRGGDPRVFSADAAAHLRAVLLAGAVKANAAEILEVTPEDAQRFADQAARADRDQVMRAMDLFMRVDGETKYATQPRTILELAAMRACHPEHEADASLEERLARMEKLLKDGVAVKRESAKPAAEKPAPAKPEPKAELRPTAEPPQAYLDAIGRVGAEIPSIRAMLPKMRFVSYADGAVTVGFGKDGILVQRVLEGKAGQIEGALSDAFGAPTRLIFRTEGAARPEKLSRETKQAIEQSYDVFGRANVVLTD